MARTENQKQLLSWISDYASDSSQKERRVVNLKKQIHQLRCKIDAASAELENAKLLKETTEQALRGYEVELAMAEASVQTIEARIASSQYEISTVGSDVEALKNQEGAMRDKFMKEMFDFNCEIRRFHALVSSSISEECCTRGSSARADQDCRGRNDAEFIALGREISSVASEIITKEQECEQEKDLQQRLKHDLVDLERKFNLMDAITKGMGELQDLTRQTSKLEDICTALSEELQKKCVCPSCHLDNAESLEGILQAEDNKIDLL